MVQQDVAWRRTSQARGLDGDPRINSSYGWQPDEMIAEDYRQLFGSANARGGGQINTEIPLAADVPGLADFLANTFTKPPAHDATATTATAAAATTAAATTATATATATADGACAAADLRSGDGTRPGEDDGTAAFSLSAPASVTVRDRHVAGSARALAAARTPRSRREPSASHGIARTAPATGSARAPTASRSSVESRARQPRPA